MLLSMYASYHWAKWHCKEDYVIAMSVFIILVSFLSAYLYFPVLSFPFYALCYEIQGSPIPPEGYSEWIPTYEIRFLTAEVSSLQPHDSVQDWRYQLLGYHLIFLNMEIWYIAYKDFWHFGLTFPLLFFFLVNILGAIVGYGIGKIRGISEWETNMRWNLLGIIIGCVFLGVGFWLGNMGVVETGRVPPWGEDWSEYTITLYPYRGDALHFSLFGIVVLAIVIGKLLFEYCQL